MCLGETRKTESPASQGRGADCLEDLGGRRCQQDARSFPTESCAPFRFAACSGNGGCDGWRRKDSLMRLFSKLTAHSHGLSHDFIYRRTMSFSDIRMPALKR